MPDDAERARVTLVIGKNNENIILSKFWKFVVDKHMVVVYYEVVAKINEHRTYKNINIATDTY